MFRMFYGRTAFCHTSNFVHTLLIFTWVNGKHMFQCWMMWTPFKKWNFGLSSNVIPCSHYASANYTWLEAQVLQNVLLKLNSKLLGWLTSLLMLLFLSHDNLCSQALNSSWNSSSSRGPHKENWRWGWCLASLGMFPCQPIPVLILLWECTTWTCVLFGSIAHSEDKYFLALESHKSG